MNFYEYVNFGLIKKHQEKKAAKISNRVSKLTKKQALAMIDPPTAKEKKTSTLKNSVILGGLGYLIGKGLHQSKVNKLVKKLMKKNPSMTFDEALKQAKALLGDSKTKSLMLAGIGAGTGAYLSKKAADFDEAQSAKHKGEAKVETERYLDSHPVKKFIGKLKKEDPEELSKNLLQDDIKYLKEHGTKSDLQKYYTAESMKQLIRSMQNDKNKT